MTKIGKLFQNYTVNNGRLDFRIFDVREMDTKTRAIYEALLALESAERLREQVHGHDGKMRAQVLLIKTLDSLLKEIEDLTK